MFGRVLPFIILNYYCVELPLYNLAICRIKFIKLDLFRLNINNFKKSIAKSRYLIFINKLKIRDRDF